MPHLNPSSQGDGPRKAWLQSPVETNQILVPSGWKEETLEVKNPSPLCAMGTKGVPPTHLLREIDQTKLSLGTLAVSGLQPG